ncbi:hypothetical protein BJ138DRAFT_1115251 [Hygrophoropsis aurantiaca]|uniref:Uncharacterized protein n=1 Tax=Hygrophoropsis aurantiaca TaxID=72124 RepID=A0ACB8A6T8_9AGAM|nr:hypothetical protein BJ138DRAFT_1115251 [Hygrophoropsis aurantiaca]
MFFSFVLFLLALPDINAVVARIRNSQFVVNTVVAHIQYPQDATTRVGTPVTAMHTRYPRDTATRSGAPVAVCSSSMSLDFDEADHSTWVSAQGAVVLSLSWCSDFDETKHSAWGSQAIAVIARVQYPQNATTRGGTPATVLQINAVPVHTRYPRHTAARSVTPVALVCLSSTKLDFDQSDHSSWASAQSAVPLPLSWLFNGATPERPKLPRAPHGCDISYARHGVRAIICPSRVRAIICPSRVHAIICPSRASSIGEQTTWIHLGVFTRFIDILISIDLHAFVFGRPYGELERLRITLRRLEYYDFLSKHYVPGIMAYTELSVYTQSKDKSRKATSWIESTPSHHGKQRRSPSDTVAHSDNDQFKFVEQIAIEDVSSVCGGSDYLTCKVPLLILSKILPIVELRQIGHLHGIRVKHRLDDDATQELMRVFKDHGDEQLCCKNTVSVLHKDRNTDLSAHEEFPPRPPTPDHRQKII